MKYITELVFAFICGGSSATFLLPIAAEQRGGAFAIGGEWFVILFAVFIGAELGKYLHAMLLEEIKANRKEEKLIAAANKRTTPAFVTTKAAENNK